jgi:hypothetical protein
VVEYHRIAGGQVKNKQPDLLQIFTQKSLFDKCIFTYAVALGKRYFSSTVAGTHRETIEITAHRFFLIAMHIQLSKFNNPACIVNFLPGAQLKRRGVIDPAPSLCFLHFAIETMPRAPP